MEFDRKWMPKGHPKSAKIDAFGAPGADLGDFLVFWRRPKKGFILMSFPSAEGVPKISRIWIFRKKVSWRGRTPSRSDRFPEFCITFLGGTLLKELNAGSKPVSKLNTLGTPWRGAADFILDKVMQKTQKIIQT